MRLNGLHILLTYQCTFECDHCFVWGSPWQSGTLTLQQVRQILDQAKEAGTIEWIFFEGGEPFLYYALMVRSVEMAIQMGFHVGLVSNAYWATSIEDALEWLKPFQGRIEDLSISSDLYHCDQPLSEFARNAVAAAERLGIPADVIQVAQPEETAEAIRGQLPAGVSAVMYRGRAAANLSGRAEKGSWERYTECPNEDLREPGRVHLDPLGNVHICQGISLGNVFETPLKEICEGYDPEAHPVTGPLLAGGPAALVSEYNLPCREAYADACHLCYEARLALRPRFPEYLKPDQMYGIPED
jgi:MoaA/NifB/PqqE/SkfB family radical SAM enzyme